MGPDAYVSPTWYASKKDHGKVVPTWNYIIASQLKGIIGVRMPISRIDGKRKMSQNRSPLDRAGFAKGLAESDRPMDQVVASLIPLGYE